MLQKTATVRMVETHRSWRHLERSHQVLVACRLSELLKFRATP
jgi:hypothetical protein